MRNICVFLYLIGCFFLPPMAMSHGYLLHACMAVLAISVITYACASEHNNYRYIKKYGYPLFAISLILTVITSPPNAIIVGLIECISITLFFSSTYSTQKFFKYYTNIILVLSLCAIVAELLYKYYPMESLHLMHLDFSVNRYEYDIYLPFDLTSPYWIDHFSALNRHYLFFGEPGIAPAFMVAALYFIYTEEKKTIVVKMIQIGILVVAMCLTLSTTFPVALFGFVFLYYYFSHKQSFKSTILYTILGGVAIYAFLYMPYFGYYAKSNSDIYGVNVEARGEMAKYWVKQVQLVITVLATFYISKSKNNQPAYKGVNLVIAICAMANIMFFSNLHLIFLLMFDPIKKNFGSMQINNVK